MYGEREGHRGARVQAGVAEGAACCAGDAAARHCAGHGAEQGLTGGQHVGDGDVAGVAWAGVEDDHGVGVGAAGADAGYAGGFVDAQVGLRDDS